jgi:hypothetical protein
MRFEFDAELWPFEAGAGWVFLSLPEDESELIRGLPREPRPGFGAVRVRVTIGGTSWLTSVFPQSGGGVYVLPVKKAVRAAEGIDVGDVARVALEVL